MRFLVFIGLYKICYFVESKLLFFLFFSEINFFDLVHMNQDITCSSNAYIRGLDLFVITIRSLLFKLLQAIFQFLAFSSFYKIRLLLRHQNWYQNKVLPLADGHLRWSWHASSQRFLKDYKITNICQESKTNDVQIQRCC